MVIEQALSYAAVVIDASHRGMPANGFCLMANRLYVGATVLQHLKGLK